MKKIVGREIQVGDVLDMAVGPTLVLAVRQAHGCIECRVPGGASRRDSPYLSFFPGQSVRVLSTDLGRAERHLARDRERIAAWRSRARTRTPTPETAEDALAPPGRSNEGVSGEEE